MTSVQWFSCEKVQECLYLIVEPYFFEDNRCNCWLIKGPSRDVLIDTGLGVCDMKQYLERAGLIDGEGGARPCDVILTHAHFDHSGGAHHFPRVFIHVEDASAVRSGRQTETLNFVKPSNFHRQPYPGFNARHYKVPPTTCQSLRGGDLIDMGGGDHLEILHTPGHTTGSLSVYYPQKKMLFTGDFVYDTGHGSQLIDWLPNSSVSKFISSAHRFLDWLTDHPVDTVYPGHFEPISASHLSQLLSEYIAVKDTCTGHTSSSCLKGATWCYFLCGCFRYCPCLEF